MTMILAIDREVNIPRSLGSVVKPEEKPWMVQVETEPCGTGHPVPSNPMTSATSSMSSREDSRRLISLARSLLTRVVAHL